MSFETFKTAFMNQCKQAGLDEAGIDRAIDVALAKEAGMEDVIGTPASLALKGIGTGLGKAWGGAKAMGPLALAAYAGLPIAAGAAIGGTAAKLQDLDEDDVADVRRRESIENYRQLAREMQMRSQARQPAPTRARSPIIR